MEPPPGNAQRTAQQSAPPPPERKILVIIIITSILFPAMEQAEPQPFESERCASTFQLRLGGRQLHAHRFGGRATEGGAGGNDGGQVQALHDIGFEEIAFRLEIVQREVFQIAAALVAQKHQMPHDLVARRKGRPFLAR